MLKPVIGVLMMVGSAVFAYLYDTGRWPAVWSVIQHGQIPAATGQQGVGQTNVGGVDFPSGGTGLPGFPTGADPGGNYGGF